MDELDAGNIDSLINGLSGPILIAFYSRACGPCKALMPTFEKMYRERREFNFAKYCLTPGINIHKAATIGVQRMPAIRLYKDGNLVDEVSGKIRLADIEAMIQKYKNTL